MNMQRKNTNPFDELRTEAEALLESRSREAAAMPGHIHELIHELEVHQTELQIQNEELKRTQQELSELHREYRDLYEFAPCGYATLNPKGMISRINLTAVKMLGLRRNYAGLDYFSNLVAAHHQDAFRQALQLAGQTGEIQRLELPLASEQTDLWASVDIEADRSSSGRVRQWRVTFSDVTDRVTIYEALQASEGKYRSMFQGMASGAALLELQPANAEGRHRQALIVETNPAFQKMTGLTGDEMTGKYIHDIWPRSWPPWFEKLLHAMRSGHPLQSELYLSERDKHLLVMTFPTTRERIVCTFIDISAQKEIQAIMAEARDTLEEQVTAGASALENTGRRLDAERSNRKQAQERLEAKRAELEETSLSLSDARSAFKVLLHQRDLDRQRLEERVQSNVNDLLRPVLNKLAESCKSDRQQRWIKVLQRNIDEITAPMAHRLIIEFRRLSPVETQVAELIRQGNTTKEIATLLGVAKSTVDFHRLNIRRKLNISGKSINLRTYLNALS